MFAVYARAKLPWIAAGRPDFGSSAKLCPYGIVAISNPAPAQKHRAKLDAVVLMGIVKP